MKFAGRVICFRQPFSMIAKVQWRCSCGVGKRFQRLLWQRLGWEGNRNHAQQHPLALVDWMANQARLQLPKVGQTVYARDGNGLDDWLRHRRAEAEAAARAHALKAPW